MNLNNKQPDISIVLPTYNVGEYIDRCLESCINQSLQNIEIIVVDDCGQDDSIIRAEKWASRDRRIKIVKNNRNLGTYHARRIGTENSKGKFILYLDPDDSLHESAAELIHKTAIESNPNIIFFGIEQIPKLRFLSKKPRLPDNLESTKDFSEKIIKTPNLNFGTPGKAYARSTILSAFKTLNIDTDCKLTFAEDALIFFTALINSEKSRTINSPIYYYHRNPTSVTKQKDAESIKYKTNQIEKVISHLDQLLLFSDASIQGTPKKRALHYIKSKLISDKLLISRFMRTPDGSSVYFKNVAQSWRHRFANADLIRLLLFIISLGLIKV